MSVFNILKHCFYISIFTFRKNSFIIIFFQLNLSENEEFLYQILQIETFDNTEAI